MRPPLALTMGDPGGIGPDITLLSWRERTVRAVPPFVLFADPEVIAERAMLLGCEPPVIMHDAQEAAEIFPEALPVIPLASHAPHRVGRTDPEVAASVIDSIDAALDHVRRGHASALVTNPIAKAPLLHAGFPHPGHTEYLGELSERLFDTPARPVMMLWSEDLAVVPVTVHIPLRHVIEVLTPNLIVETARCVIADLQRRFGLDRPRLAVCGLNPHAGEDGTIGLEDRDIIAPAIAELVHEGHHVTGPWPADTLFHAAARSSYDAVLAMYHDQALIPIKTIAFDSAVNVTLGLPFIRTSPDHGTAFSLAGTGKARPDSLIAALKLADRLAERPA